MKEIYGIHDGKKELLAIATDADFSRTYDVINRIFGKKMAVYRGGER